jgi:hypothetical protein
MHRGLAVGALTAFVTALFGLLFSSYATPAEAQDSAWLERHAWAADTAWVPELGWLEQQHEACRAASGSYAADPCDRFISEALDRIYGIADFRSSADGGPGYLGMSAVLSAVRYGGSGWTQLGNGGSQAAIDESQARANAGDAVLAALPTSSGGHVALILPGQTTPSSSWQRSVPNSASLFISNSQRSYVGKPLSFSFGGDTADQVVFFARGPGRGAVAAVRGQAVDQPAAQGDAPFENAAEQSSYLEAPVEAGIPGLEANAPPQLANALAAADKATRSGEEVVEAAARVYGLWCETGDLDKAPGKIKAVVINGTGGMLSWGHVDKARAYAFEGEIARPIVKIERNGAIVSISFAQSADGVQQSTAFFVLDGEDKLFESHIFDHANSEIRPKDTILERCPGRQKQTAGG